MLYLHFLTFGLAQKIRGLNNFLLFTFHIVVLETPEGKSSDQLSILRKKLGHLGIDGSLCVPGQHNHLLCPMVYDFFYFFTYMELL